MRIAGSEYLKLFSNKIFLICIIAFFCADSLFFVMLQSSDYENSAISSDVGAYEQLIRECNGAEDKNAFFESKNTEIQIAQILLHNGNADEYKKKYPKLYDNAAGLDLNDDELFNRSVMLSNIQAQLSHIDSYEEFISNMKSRAEQQSSFSIFAEPDSFSFRNIEKTPMDFAEVKGVKPILGNNKAVEAATSYEVSSYILLIIVLLVNILMFSVEREKGLYVLVRSTAKGRLSTIACKLLVVLSVTAVVSLLFYASNIMMAGTVYGFGDLSRPVQSSELFLNCALNVTMLEYLILWVLGKTLLLCSLSMLTAFLFVVIKSSAKTYLILAAALIFEFSCFIFIDGSSVLASLKFINIFYLISGNNIFGCYQNVNIFSQPINIITVFIGLAVALSVVGILGAALAFSRLSQHNGKLVLLDRLMSRLGRFKKINGSVRIYSGEAYKHYKTSFALVAVIILVALGFVSYNDDLSIIFRSPQESAYDTYMQTLEGELDEEKYDFIESERAYFDELTREAEELSADNTISVEEKTNRLNTIDGILSIRGMAFEDICAQLEYVNEKAELTGEKPALVNEVVNKRLTMDTFREWEYFALLLAVVIFCTSNILAIEYKTSMVNLISANKHGKARLLIIKLLTVLITTVISYILIYLPYMLNFIKTFGTASFDLPLATSLKLNASEIVLYIGQSFDINSSVPKGTAAYYRLYSSSNSKIAAVTRGGGVVKGVATGKATVTCILNNGKKAICNVYIMPQSKKISNVPLIGQSKLPTGCETCSATMLLNFYGYKISETTFADKYLVKKPFGYSNGSYTGPDPNCAFVGTPYSSNSYGAYAPIMVKCMNKYLSDKSYKAVEISGKSLEYLSGKYVAQGQPIMVWATINMSPSFKTTTWRVNYTDENAKYKLGSYYTWTAGEHCLLLTGYDKDYYYFNDPWTNARTRYSKSLVNTRYNELGKQAVVMVKK